MDGNASQKLNPDGINKKALATSPILKGKIVLTKYPAFTIRNDCQREIRCCKITLQAAARVIREINNKTSTGAIQNKFTCFRAAPTSSPSTNQSRTDNAAILIMIPSTSLS
jgi:hypothetical protein